MDEKLLKKLKEKDNYSTNQYQRIEYLAQYMRKKGFNKDYKQNVIKLITYYSYIKSIDTKNYHKDYIVPFTSYISKHYDQDKAKLYFDEKITEQEFLEEFISYQKGMEENKTHSKRKTKASIFKLIRRNVTMKTKRASTIDNKGLIKIEFKEKVRNCFVNIKSFFENVYYKRHTIKSEQAIANWWEEYIANLKAVQQSEDYQNFFCNKEESKLTEPTQEGTNISPNQEKTYKK